MGSPLVDVAKLAGSVEWTDSAELLLPKWQFALMALASRVQLMSRCTRGRSPVDNEVTELCGSLGSRLECQPLAGCRGVQDDRQLSAVDPK